MGIESDTVTAEPIKDSPAPTTPSTNPTPFTSGTSSTGSPAVIPSPQQSSTTGTPLATTSHPPTALVLSTAGAAGVGPDPVTAGEVTPSPAPSTASTNPVPSTSITPPASDTTAPGSSAAGSSTETAAPRQTAFTQGQPIVEVTATPSPTGSPSPPTASAGSSATRPPGEGNSSTTNQGIRTPEPTANTSHSLPSTSLPTPSTRNLSESTSVNPPSTGTCCDTSLILSRIEGTPSKTMSGAVDTVEGMDGIQRDLDRFRRWPPVKVMESSDATCKVLLMGRGSAKHRQTQAGHERAESSSEEKDLGVLGDEKLGIT
ncbi:hypothetical protein DUI87_15616 [Hirundo rustica rustica]|uniref:Uncharacterized protein n=1 Tax=Hirundo rustica rustica TaxID=333673 RepID=A0A3M0JYY8_HIRRU|nr:hypothetical protein DUI87_15616 [Hirundo rustica rustica]